VPKSQRIQENTVGKPNDIIVVHRYGGQFYTLEPQAGANSAQDRL